MNHKESLLTRIERYFEQRQALGGDIAYTTEFVAEPEFVAESVSAFAETSVATSNEPIALGTRTLVKDTFNNISETMNRKSEKESAHHEQSLMFGAAEEAGKSAAQSNIPQSSTTSKTTDTSSYIEQAWRSTASLEDLYNEIHTCLNCKLGATRTKFVFGVGNPNADILVIGEAPGADEDAQGEPFVGRAGQLLNKILEAINLKREEVYIANIIKCRPPENRRPEADEVEQCEPYLYKQIDLLQPKIILALGLTAVNTLLKTKHTMGAIRGKTLEFRGVPMIATYHPAALLRNPEWKKAAWEDVKMLRSMYDSMA